jgi:hypothetical protein
MALKEHRVDVAAGTAADWLLEPAEAPAYEALHRSQEAAEAAARRRAEAIKRLRFRAVSDRDIADILTVLRLDDDGD